MLNILLECPGCKVPQALGSYEYRVTAEDPLAQALYCPICNTKFYFTEMPDTPEYED